VPLPAAALQFPLAHPAAAAIISGPRNADQFRANLDLLRHPIPAALWADLRRAGLLHPAAPVPSWWGRTRGGMRMAMDKATIELLARRAGLDMALAEFSDDVAAAAAQAGNAVERMKTPTEPRAEPWPPMRAGNGL
jgi:hypothetical protein